MKTKDLLRQRAAERLRGLGFEVGDRVRHVEHGLEAVVTGWSSEGFDKKKGERRPNTIVLIDDDGDKHHYNPERLVKIEQPPAAA